MPKCSKCPFFMKIKEAFKKLKSKFRKGRVDATEDVCEKS
jgi:aminoglycoside phosphotransferase